MNRVFTKGFILLAVLLVVLAGLSAAMLLLTPEEGRTGNFWISFWAILFSVVLSFSYMIFHVVAGKDDFAPVPLLLGLSTTIACYCIFVLGNVLVSHFWLRLPQNAYIATHIAGFMLLVGGGGGDALFGDDEYGMATRAWSFTINPGLNVSFDNVAVEFGTFQGDDLIYAGTGNDFVYAGGGGDEVYGGDGDDTVIGEAGDDFARVPGLARARDDAGFGQLHDAIGEELRVNAQVALVHQIAQDGVRDDADG